MVDHSKKGMTLTNQIAKYGLEEGTKRYNEWKKKAYSSLHKTLDGMIRDFGLEEGTKRYNEWKEKLKNRGTLQGYISKYGLEEGPKRYKEKNSKLSISIEALTRAGKTKEEIIAIRDKHAKKSAMTLDNQIAKYGLEEGTKRYNEWKEKSRERSQWTIEYWTSRNYDEKTAKEIVSQIQSTSTLDKFIQRYGIEKGTKKYIETNEKKTRNWNSSGSISKLEKAFFNELSNHTYINDNGKTSRILCGNKLYYCDYFHACNNRIIEIYGDYWHMNPLIYGATDINKTTKEVASEIWNKDRERIQNLNKEGYEILIIWESDIYHRYDEMIHKAKTFLEEQ